MRNPIRPQIKIVMLVALCALFALAGSPHTASAQSGSTGGSIGNDEKSLSGTRSTEPERPAKRDKPSDEPRRAAGRSTGGSGNFDGAWIFTSAGCSGAGSTPGIISGGRLTIQNGGGRVNPNGAFRGFAAGNGLTLVAVGRLSGTSGGGSFNRSDGCIGRWTAIKN
jgi:hypothetical protein